MIQICMWCLEQCPHDSGVLGPEHWLTSNLAGVGFRVKVLHSPLRDLYPASSGFSGLEQEGAR